jgi:spermidine/putrescine transport system permease protein
MQHGLWRLGRFVFWLYVTAIYAFLFFPLVIIAAFSFHKGKNPTHWPPQWFTLKWFSALFDDQALLTALRNSLVVGLVAVTLSLILGTLMALAIHRYRFWGSGPLYALTMVPVFVPGLVLGVALLILFSRFNVELSLNTIIVGHMVFLVPVILSAILARLERLSPSYEQASRDLGANAWQTFFFVTLPSIRTAMIGAVLFAFTLSFDNIVMTFFLTGFKKTLPLEFWGRIRFGLTPATNAIATLMVLISIVLIIAANRLMNEA